jgi:hypothetical protein
MTIRSAWLSSHNRDQAQPANATTCKLEWTYFYRRGDEAYDEDKDPSDEYDDNGDYEADKEADGDDDDYGVENNGDYNVAENELLAPKLNFPPKLLGGKEEGDQQVLKAGGRDRQLIESLKKWDPGKQITF